MLYACPVFQQSNAGSAFFMQLVAGIDALSAIDAGIGGLEAGRI